MCHIINKLFWTVLLGTIPNPPVMLNNRQGVQKNGAKAAKVWHKDVQITCRDSCVCACVCARACVCVWGGVRYCALVAPQTLRRSEWA